MQGSGSLSYCLSSQHRSAARDHGAMLVAMVCSTVQALRLAGFGLGLRPGSGLGAHFCGKVWAPMSGSS